jgi:hypothetical protein
MPAKRAAFSIDEKVALRKHSQQDRSLSQKDLVIWFEESFGKPIRQPTVSEILSSKYAFRTILIWSALYISGLFVTKAS